MTDQWLERFEQRIADRAATRETLVVLGETLVLKPTIAPQVALRYYDAKIRLIQYYVDREKAQAAGKPVPELAADLHDTVLLELVEETARACIDPESVPAWERLRSSDRPNPLAWRDVMSLCEYLLDKASGVPTDGPTESSDGPTNTSKSSKGASPSRAAKRKS